MSGANDKWQNFVPSNTKLSGMWSQYFLVLLTDFYLVTFNATVCGRMCLKHGHNSLVLIKTANASNSHRQKTTVIHLRVHVKGERF